MGFTASTANAQTTGPGTYSPVSSWDQKFQCDTQANCPRFVVLSNWNNAAVLDRETGLVWERSRSNAPGFTFFSAQTHCAGLSVSGRLGWRLPSVQELATLIDQTVPAVIPNTIPSIPRGHPFLAATLFGEHWTSTSSSDGLRNAWQVTFFGGAVDGTQSVDTTKYAWCVTGGRGQDVQ